LSWVISLLLSGNTKVNEGKEWSEHIEEKDTKNDLPSTYLLLISSVAAIGFGRIFGYYSESVFVAEISWFF